MKKNISTIISRKNKNINNKNKNFLNNIIKNQNLTEEKEKKIFIGSIFNNIFFFINYSLLFLINKYKYIIILIIFILLLKNT